MRRVLVLILVLVLVGCGGGRSHGPTTLIGRGMPKTQPDRDPLRRIVLVYPYTKEKLDLLYFHDGHYDAKAMRKIENLMRDRRANKIGTIDPELIDFLVDIRKRLALPERVPFQILSGYRSPKSNAQLARTNGNVAKDSLHMHGWAVDFRIEGINGRAVAEIAKTMQRGGVAYYPTSKHLHVDLGNIRTWFEARR